jgi:hypothetical protein
MDDDAKYVQLLLPHAKSFMIGIVSQFLCVVFLMLQPEFSGVGEPEGSGTAFRYLLFCRDARSGTLYTQTAGTLSAQRCGA